MSLTPISSLEKRLLAIWLAINLCLGILVVHGYGIGFDEPGYYKYQWDASNYANGLYLYELKTEKFVSVKKMLMLK